MQYSHGMGVWATSDFEACNYGFWSSGRQNNTRYLGDGLRSPETRQNIASKGTELGTDMPWLSNTESLVCWDTASMTVGVPGSLSTLSISQTLRPSQHNEGKSCSWLDNSTLVTPCAKGESVSFIPRAPFSDDLILAGLFQVVNSPSQSVYTLWCLLVKTLLSPKKISKWWLTWPWHNSSSANKWKGANAKALAHPQSRLGMRHGHNLSPWQELQAKRGARKEEGI